MPIASVLRTRAVKCARRHPSATGGFAGIAAARDGGRSHSITTTLPRGFSYINDAAFFAQSSRMMIGAASHRITIVKKSSRLASSSISMWTSDGVDHPRHGRRDHPSYDRQAEVRPSSSLGSRGRHDRMGEQRLCRAHGDGTKQGLGCGDTGKGSRPRYAGPSGRRRLFLPVSSVDDGADFSDAVERRRNHMSFMQS